MIDSGNGYDCGSRRGNDNNYDINLKYSKDKGVWGRYSLVVVVAVISVWCYSIEFT